MTPASSPVIYPPLIDDLGQPVSIRSDDAIEAHEPGRNNAWAAAGLPPLGWNAGKPDGSRMVGWTLRRKGKSAIVAEHAFSINPQSITRTDSSRNQLFATQAAFYVDDFGPGSVNIQINQLVAHGRASAQAGGGLSRATMREDVVRFYDLIYIEATSNPGRYDIFFHDNHLWDQITGKVPERVYFPAQAWQLVRSVQQQNVWQLQLTMGTLDAPPAASKSTPQVPGQPKIKVHVVKKGETLKKIAARLAGRNATHKRVLQLEQQIEALTAKYGKDDITKNRDVPVYSAANPQQWLGNTHVTRLHLAVGEKIILPAG